MSAAYRVSRSATRLATAAASALLLAGCTVWTPIHQNEAQLQGPAPYPNQTPMNSALSCLRQYRGNQDLRIGVADFVDGSGATQGGADVNSRYFSQRPDLMLMVALSKAGVRLVNRTSTAVAEWEMRQAMDRRLGEGKPVEVGKVKYQYRPVRAGEILGSDYYVHGAITELNWNLASNVEEYGFLGVTAGKRVYRISMAIDLAVTDTQTTEVVMARSYAKQIVGYQVGDGVFRFVDTGMGGSKVELFESNLGDKKNEPVQQALRWLVETAAYDIVATLDGRHASCDMLVPGTQGDVPPRQVGVGGLLPFMGDKPGIVGREPDPRGRHIVPGSAPAAAEAPAPVAPVPAMPEPAAPAAFPMTPSAAIPQTPPAAMPLVPPRALHKAELRSGQVTVRFGSDVVRLDAGGNFGMFQAASFVEPMAPPPVPRTPSAVLVDTAWAVPAGGGELTKESAHLQVPRRERRMRHVVEHRPAIVEPAPHHVRAPTGERKVADRSSVPSAGECGVVDASGSGGACAAPGTPGLRGADL